VLTSLGGLFMFGVSGLNNYHRPFEFVLFVVLINCLDVICSSS